MRRELHADKSPAAQISGLSRRRVSAARLGVERETFNFSGPHGHSAVGNNLRTRHSA